MILMLEIKFEKMDGKHKWFDGEIDFIGEKLKIKN